MSVTAQRPRNFVDPRALLATSQKKKSNTHFDAVLPSGRDHLATVKLKRRHAMVVLDRLENPSSAEIPNLLDYFFRV